MQVFDKSTKLIIAPKLYCRTCSFYQARVWVLLGKLGRKKIKRIAVLHWDLS